MFLGLNENDNNLEERRYRKSRIRERYESSPFSLMSSERMIFEKMDYFQKVICLGQSCPFWAKTDDSCLNGRVFGFPVETIHIP